MTKVSTKSIILGLSRKSSSLHALSHKT